MIMIPALACDDRLYTELVELLRGDFECSVVNPAAPTMAACAEAVLGGAPEEPFAVLGTSFGGHVAREVALTAPERVAALVVMGAGAATGAGAADVFAERRRAVEEGELPDYLETMARTIVFESDGRGEAAANAFRLMARDVAPSRFLAQAEALARRDDHSTTISRIACPTLLLWGEKDSFSDPKAAKAMAGVMPNAELSIIAECGHLPCLERPMRVASEIRRVLRPQV
ncbi:alpha/beta fold hydrolase [Consotaella salsifontis]|nr:alpha/beta hydrolase [Consotaella salsifontis]